MPTDSSDVSGILAPLLYGVVLALPLLGVGLFCALYRLVDTEPRRVLGEVAEATVAEREESVHAGR